MTNARAAKNITPNTANHARVLIVDDERPNREILRMMLAPDGYLLQTAAGGEEALAIVATQPPDLILLDIMMPGMDGYEVADRIKGNPATRNIPVVMITALDDRRSKMLGLNAGATDFLTKPVDRAELSMRVRNLLRLKAYGDYVARMEEVEQLKDGFLSTVSHELRTPLTSIRGSLGLLASGAVGVLSADVGEVVAIAERNAIRLMALVNDILDLERLETGKIELQFAQVSIASILRRATESLTTFGDQRGVTVVAPEQSSYVWADEDRIVQVMVNLLSNAVKFSPDGGVVTIGVVVRENWVEFRVTDVGRGVPAIYRHSIFERFRQVETSDSREKGGVGLGLAICKSIVERHGGTIGIDSEEGAGSSFWFRLATTASLFGPQPEQPILVCGDRRGLLADVIKEAGYPVLTAPTDMAAWEAIEHSLVAAVLTKSDSELIRRLRMYPALNRVPVILFDDPVTLPEEALLDDFVSVLPRDADNRELLVTIRDSIEHARALTWMHGMDSHPQP